MKHEIFDKYAEKVAAHFLITKDELFKKYHDRTACDARHLFCYLARERNARYPEVFKYMQSQGFPGDISLVRYGHKVTSALIKKDRDYATIVKRLTAETQL